MASDPVQDHLDRLRKDRSLPRPDLTLGFLTEQFKRDVAKPFKQLGDLSELWGQLLPQRLAEQCRLVGFSRGVLHIEVDNPAAHFEIDRLLRSGLQKQLIEGHRGPAFRKISIKVVGRRSAEAVDARRLPPEGDTNPSLSPDQQPALGRSVPGEDSA